MKEKNRIGIIIFLVACGMITTKNYTMVIGQGARIETTDKASQLPWSFEFYNKTSKSFFLAVHKDATKETIVIIQIEPRKKVRAAYVDQNEPIELNFDGKQFVIKPNPGETIYVTYDGNLRPQTGPLKGILGITESGLDNRKNIQASAIKKIMAKKPKPTMQKPPVKTPIREHKEIKEIKQSRKIAGIEATNRLFTFAKSSSEVGSKSWDKIYEQLEMLDKEKIDMDIRDQDGYTPLFYAIREDNPVAMFLLQNEANPNLTYNFQDVQDMTLLQLIFLKNHFALGGEVPYEEKFPHSQNKEALSYIIKLLLQYKADPNVTDKNGNTPLFFAVSLLRAKSGIQEQLISDLIQNGANINYQNNSGDTPLHVAIRVGVGDKIKAYLIENGARLDIKNNAGQTPEEIAVEILEQKKVNGRIKQ